MKIVPIKQNVYQTFPLTHKVKKTILREEQIQVGTRQGIIDYETIYQEPIFDEDGNEVEQTPLQQPIYGEMPIFENQTVTETIEVDEDLDGVIEITAEEYQGLRAKTHCFTNDLKAVRQCTEAELAEVNQIRANRERDESKQRQISALKTEIIGIKEDIEQVDLFGMVRTDIAEKRTRAAEIVNEIRRLIGKPIREVTTE